MRVRPREARRTPPRPALRAFLRRSRRARPTERRSRRPRRRSGEARERPLLLRRLDPSSDVVRLRARPEHKAPHVTHGPSARHVLGLALVLIEPHCALLMQHGHGCQRIVLGLSDSGRLVALLFGHAGLIGALPGDLVNGLARGSLDEVLALGGPYLVVVVVLL